MTCHEVQNLLNPFIDGELDLVHNLEIERHLQDCVGCQTSYQNQLTLKKALKSEALYYKLPADLPAKIRTKLRHSTARQAASPPRIWLRRGLVAGVALLAVMLVVGGLAVLLNGLSANNDRLA
jgi:anti-sigma factor RsiW